MAVTVNDIDFFLSVSGSSDGGAESSTELVSGTTNGLWPNISDALRTSGGTRYKKFFIQNSHSTDSMVQPSIWISESPVGVVVQIGLGMGSADDTASSQANMAPWSANAKVAAVSTSADTRTVFVYGISSGGVPIAESFLLSGTTEVLSANTYSKVWSVQLSSVSGTSTVTLKQGAGGTARGTIGPTFVTCWLWVTALTKATGLWLPDLLPTTAYAIWCKQSWDAGLSAQRPTRQIVSIEEKP
jgi:hypothetical protein